MKIYFIFIIALTAIAFLPMVWAQTTNPCPTVPPISFTASGTSQGYGQLIDFFNIAVNGCNADLTKQLTNAITQCAAKCRAPQDANYVCIPTTTPSAGNCNAQTMQNSCRLLPDLQFSCVVKQPVILTCSCDYIPFPTVPKQEEIR
jgi:hypothetical protein